IIVLDLDMVERAPITFDWRIVFDNALEGEFDVLGSHFAIAAGEFDALFQAEAHMGRIDLLDFLGCLKSPSPFGSRPVVRELRIDAVHHIYIVGVLVRSEERRGRERGEEWEVEVRLIGAGNYG